MCGRLTLQTSMTELSAFLDGLRMPLFTGLTPRYNICPTQPVACIRQSNSNQPEGVTLRWGLVPFWADELKIGARMINARSETVATKPAFRKAFKSRRCLVLADGFYEWKKSGSSRQPYYISRVDNQPMLMAGLWESWRSKQEPDSQPVETCTILTTSANEIMEPLHDRMPVILDQQHYDFWLDNQFSDRAELEKLLVPFSADQLQTYPVDTFVNKAANDQPECIEPIAPPKSLFPD